jgi:hypothetical protein
MLTPKNRSYPSMEGEAASLALLGGVAALATSILLLED